MTQLRARLLLAGLIAGALALLALANWLMGRPIL
jgi:hypothetical protein